MPQVGARCFPRKDRLGDIAHAVGVDAVIKPLRRVTNRRRGDGPFHYAGGCLLSTVGDFTDSMSRTRSRIAGATVVSGEHCLDDGHTDTRTGSAKPTLIQFAQPEGRASARQMGCFAFANWATIAAQKAGRSLGDRLETN
jgi:hypothetical protein